MSQLVYKKGSLFQAAEPNAVLLHACNTKGSWGAGIAQQFKFKYPKAFEQYADYCKEIPSEELIGSYVKLQDEGITIACLFTSVDYGDKKDSIDSILKNTKSSVVDFLATMPYKATVHSPKINAGLFKVPWKDTERIIKACLEDRPDVTWVVWER